MEDKIWVHRPAPAGFDLLAAKNLFEGIAGKVLSDYGHEVDFQPDPGYPDGRYGNGHVRATWMVFIEREFQLVEQDRKRPPIEFPCSTCNGSNVPGERPNSAWPTLRDLERPAVDPVIHINLAGDFPGPSAEVIARIKATMDNMDRLNRGININGPCVRLRTEEEVAEMEAIRKACRSWPERAFFAGIDAVKGWWGKRRARVVESQEKRATEDFFGVGVPIEPDGHCEDCGELTVFAPVGGKNLCHECAENAAGLRVAFSLEELADAPPVWLDSIDLFTERLKQAGLLVVQMRHGEGIKEMFDEAWAMRPALCTEELAEVKALLREWIDTPLGVNSLAINRLRRKTVALLSGPKANGDKL